MANVAPAPLQTPLMDDSGNMSPAWQGYFGQTLPKALNSTPTALPADASDATTNMALTNAIKAALIAAGICK